MHSEPGEMKLLIKWSMHEAHSRFLLNTFRESDHLSDCYLFAEGKPIPCHKLLLSLHSTYFHDIFKLTLGKTPVVMLNSDVSYQDAMDVLEFIYTGQVNVKASRIEHFCEVAKILNIFGIVTSVLEATNETGQNINTNTDSSPERQLEARQESTRDVDDVMELAPEVLPRIKTETGSQSVVTESQMFKPPKVKISASQKGKENINQRKNLRVSKKPLKIKLPVGIKHRRPSAMPTSTATIERTFKCSFCNKEQKTKKGNTKHQQECASNPNQVLNQCPKCFKRFKSGNFYTHKKTCNVSCGRNVALLNEQTLKNLRC
jgi:BTB/POZ domain